MPSEQSALLYACSVTSPVEEIYLYRPNGPLHTAKCNFTTERDSAVHPGAGMGVYSVYSENNSGCHGYIGVYVAADEG